MGFDKFTYIAFAKTDDPESTGAAFANGVGRVLKNGASALIPFADFADHQWIRPRIDYVDVSFKLSYQHYSGGGNAGTRDDADTAFLTHRAHQSIVDLSGQLNEQFKYYYLEQFGGAALAEMIGGVLRLRSAVGDAKSAVGGVGPRTDWHPSQLGHDFSGKQISPIKGPGGTTMPEGVMSVVPRPGMQQRVLVDRTGKAVHIFGQGEFSSSTTPGHYQTMLKHVEKLAKTGEYKYFVMQRAWRTATGRVSQERAIPDIIGVRRNDVVDAWEVMSRTDVEGILRARLKRGMESIPSQYHGVYGVLPIAP